MLAFLALLLCGVDGVMGVSPDDFKSLTDVAPLLALFGERVSQQFMADSYTLADCIRK